MRKLVSYTLILLLLMNVMGYYGVFMGLKIRNEAMMIGRLDLGDFDASQTVTIHIPLSIPYVVDADEFERVDGEFEHNGEVFRLLKQKHANDTLTIICVKDAKARKINQALSAYVKTFATQQSTNNSGKLSITLIKDYLSNNFGLESISSYWETDIPQTPSYKNFIAFYTPDIIHPPERG